MNPHYEERPTSGALLTAAINTRESTGFCRRVNLRPPFPPFTIGNPEFQISMTFQRTPPPHFTLYTSS
jgi:hypothetical protein